MAAGLPMAAETHRAIEAVWRIESARLIAGLTRTVHDVGLAEDVAQDALIAAMEQWPLEGIPSRGSRPSAVVAPSMRCVVAPRSIASTGRSARPWPPRRPRPSWPPQRQP